MEKKILDAQWLQGIEYGIPILDEASLTLARNRVHQVAIEAGVGASITSSAALIATELGQNQLAHAKFGQIAVRKTRQCGVPGIEVIAADYGEGITDPAAALQDGFSTTGTLGTGLPSVYRLADEVDFDIRLGEGTCIWARKFEGAPAPACCELAIMGRAFPGEAVSGDAGFFRRLEHGVLAGIVDGLGHGLLAHKASAEAVRFALQNPGHPLDSLLLQCNERLRGSRGAVMGFLRFDGDASLVEHLGVGDINAHVYRLNESKRFVTMPHVLGQSLRSPLQLRETAPLCAGTVVIMFSDGLRAAANLSGKLELMRQPAVTIAQSLLEEYGRGNDDATVFVAKIKRFPF